QPTLIGFSPEAQKVIVEETHKRGRAAETHSTTIEGLRLSILAGIDLIQHPEILTPREAPDDLVRLIRERNVICSMLVNTMTGEAWRKHLKTKEETRSEEHTSELQSLTNLVCRLLLEKKKTPQNRLQLHLDN